MRTDETPNSSIDTIPQKIYHLYHHRVNTVLNEAPWSYLEVCLCNVWYFNDSLLSRLKGTKLWDDNVVMLFVVVVVDVMMERETA